MGTMGRITVYLIAVRLRGIVFNMILRVNESRSWPSYTHAYRISAGWMPAEAPNIAM